MTSFSAKSGTALALSDQPRAVGQAMVEACLSGARTRLADLYHAGSARLMLPRTATSDLQAVLVNTAGGVTGGDRFDWQGRAGAGAHLTLSTQAAERAYRAQPGETGRIASRLAAGAGATIHWLPQETIVFDGARLDRRLDVDLAPDATFVAVEPLVFGRTAMGERLETVSLTDRWRVRRGGRLIYADALRLTGQGEALLARPATLGGNRAVASILYTGPGAAPLLAPLRRLLPETAGASLVREDVLSVRIAAGDGLALRRVLVPVLQALRRAPLPKVWRL